MKEIIENLLITALEGGSNYWYNITSDYKNDIYSAILEQNETVEVRDIETNEFLGNLNYQKCLAAMDKLKEEDIQIYANCITENYDAFDADIFLQLAVMNEIIYG